MDMYTDLAVAAVRGYLMRNSENGLPAELTKVPLGSLSDSDILKLITFGEDAGIKLYRFKRGHEELPRVKKILGFLHSVQPQSLLDVGSGRGVFLFPFLNEFPDTSVTSLDILDYRVRFLEDISAGGISRLTAIKADICSKPFPDNSFDAVTLLEVLEHIPNVEKAINAAVKMSRRFIAVSVPSKPDNNPEHIHLLTKPILTEYFNRAGCSRLTFSGVNGHLIMIASKGEQHERTDFT